MKHALPHVRFAFAPRRRLRPGAVRRSLALACLSLVSASLAVPRARAQDGWFLIDGRLDYNYSSNSKTNAFAFDCGSGYRATSCSPVTVQYAVDGGVSISRFDQNAQVGFCSVYYPAMRSMGTPAAGGYGVVRCERIVSAVTPPRSP